MAFSLFKKKKEKKDDRYQYLVVKEVEHIAKDAINIVFEKPENFQYEPGQFLTIIKEINGSKIRRAYSLSSTPFLDENPAVTVKRVQGGVMSNYLNDHLQPGEAIEIMNPMGMFTTAYDPGKKRHAIFFGGGSGITPLISIFRTILDQEPNSQVSLIYGNRSEEYIIFNTMLDQLKEKHGSRFNLIHVLENGSGAYFGRLTHEMIQSICGEIGADNASEFYICGPGPLMDIVTGSLKKSGYPANNIRLESFEASKNDAVETNDAGGEESEVTIILDGEEFSLTMKKSQSILDQALDSELDMPYSCQSGLCTACRGRCLEGEVSIDEAEGLSQEELDEGYVLTCIGKPLSDVVKVEIG